MPITNSKISVIMSVYNHQDYVADAIESILNQTHDNFEFIIINDGSTDNSLKIIKHYMNLDSRILLINQENSGLTKALNIGIKKSSGKYLARQDADDKSTPNRLESQINAIEKHELDIITSRAYKDKKIVPNGFIYHFNRSNILRTGNIFIHGTFLIRSKVFDIQMYDETYKYAQDFKFILDALNNNFKIGSIMEPLYLLSNIDTSISNTKNNEQDNYISIALIEFFGSDKFFNYQKNTNKFFSNSLKLIFIIFIYITKKGYKLKIIK